MDFRSFFDYRIPVDPGQSALKAWVVDRLMEWFYQGKNGPSQYVARVIHKVWEGFKRA
jgi:hypothetical protein